MPDLPYPIRHISIRVPWHDNGWNGSVCNDGIRRMERQRFRFGG